ncbi:ATP-binding protein [Streptomyces sp. P9(2023)]|uniref:sensor histidine kinase n=1 Tax=Streptomyces sp. P9(2023) TaxID=3064394 RepID=UPI0028F445E2|nr:ATP-binding protein [Streptomyces sp. P9(2023)]MDT9687541.1 ATP-binding protein [Streptomyces sp. P9(2023)]
MPEPAAGEAREREEPKEAEEAGEPKEAGGPGDGEGAPPDRSTRTAAAARIAQGAVPVHAVRAGAVLVQLVAEFLERSRTPVSYDDPARTRLLARVQSAVTRSLEEAADGYDLHLLDVVRDSTRASRDAMAREIHDRVGSAAGLALRQLELYELTQNVSSSTNPRLDALKQAILETMQSTRDIVTELRAGAHSAGALGVALSAFVTAMAIDRPVVEIRVEDVDEPLPDAVGEHLFLVLREGLRNALAHARASRVTVDVRGDTPGDTQAHGDGRRVRASVSDDGVGLPPDQEFGNGLASVAERIRLLGGRMEIRSAPGHGTTLAFSVPIGEE